MRKSSIVLVTGLFALAVFSAGLASAQEVYDVGQVVVTARRTPTPLKNVMTTVSVITRKDIEDSGAQNLGAVLRTAEGVQINQYGSTGSITNVNLRGANATQVLVLVDGRPINDPATGMAEISRIPASQIERIEVMRTPAASLYGANAVGGVIQVFTKATTKEHRFHWSAVGGGFNTRSTDLEWQSPVQGGALRAGFSALATDGNRENSNYRSDDANASYVLNLSNDRHVDFKMLLHHDRLGVPGSMPAESFADRDATQQFYGSDRISRPYDFQKTGSGSFQTNAVLLKKKNSSLSLIMYRDAQSMSFFQEFLVMDSGDFTNHVNRENARYRTDDFGGDLQYETKLRKHSIILGLNARHDRFATTNLVRDMNNGTGTIQNWKNDAGNKAVFAQDEISFGEKWGMTVGARLDRHDVYGSQFSPNLSVMRRGNNNIRFSVTRAFRAPALNDLFWPEDAFSKGNASLTPEKALFYELGLERNFIGDSTLHLNIFNRRTNDMIAWAPTGPPDSYGNPKWQPSNLNIMMTRGAEIEISARLSKHTSLSVSDTWLDSKQKTMDLVNATTNALSPFTRRAVSTPRNLAKCRVAFTSNKFSARLDGRYSSAKLNYYSNWNSWPVVGMDSKRLSASFVLDAGTSWKLGKATTIRIDGTNLLNRRYAERFGSTVSDRNYPMPGRSASIQLIWDM